MIIVHPKDSTTDFLKELYEPLCENDKIYTQKNSNSKINKAIQHNSGETIMLLGHGCENGLLSRENDNCSLNRLIISPKSVNFLRFKTVIGIWCNANLFAEKYGLEGLFSGLIISELSEALDWGINTTQEELDKENKLFAERLRYCLDNCKLSNIPIIMRELDKNKTELTNFNYKNIFYYS